ncbi:unnamed protein product [Ilex paraguariensis]|uniref:Uncharacterized protein n=1 Tax=Ilex paraguariensis TaxID=185542 RepID=A0ABC8S2E8_9AQUA
MASSQSLTLISKCTILPDQKSILSDLKLLVSDLPMLSYHYIQKGGLFTRPPVPIDSRIFLLQCGLSQTLSLFPPLVGRLKTDPSGYVYITCNDAEVDFIHASAIHIHVRDILSPTDVPNYVKEFFAFDRTPSYDGHFKPILAMQVIELADGVFIGCALNHAVTDGMSFWNFFNIFVEISRVPDFRRESVLILPAVLRVPEDGPKSQIDGEAKQQSFEGRRWEDNAVEMAIKHLVTCARKLPSSKTTTFRMAVNCRHRLEPKLDSYYFGNAIQSIPTYASADNVLSRDL